MFIQICFNNKSFLDLPQEVNPLVQNSNHLLEDLRRLNQLKDRLDEKDLEIKQRMQTRKKAV